MSNGLTKVEIKLSQMLEERDKQIAELKEMGRVMIAGYANGLSDIAIAKAWKLFDYEHNNH